MKFIIIYLCALLLATTPLSGRDGKQIMGFYSLQTGRSYINIKNNKSTKDLVATSATESQRAMDHQRGINFLQNEDDHSTYSQNFGNAVARYYGYALNSYGSGYGSAKINNPSSINQNYYASNNKEFSRLDKQKGANRQLHSSEEDFILKNSEEYAHTKGISREKAYEILNIAARMMVDKDTNDFINSRENASFEMENGEEPVTKNLNEDERGYNLSDLRQAEEYLAKKSDGLNFIDVHKNFTKTNYFTTNSWEQYTDGSWDPNNEVGLTQDLPIFFALKPAVVAGKDMAKVGVNGVAKGAKGLISKVESNAASKIMQNLPQGASFNGATGIINLNGKNYIPVGTNSITKSPIIREIDYMKDKLVLKGNYYMTSSNGLEVIGKNALKNNQLKQGSSTFLYGIKNEYLKNSGKYSENITNFINGYIIPGMPDVALWSVRGAEINAIWNYRDTKQNIENITDSLINFYKAHKDNKNDK